VVCDSSPETAFYILTYESGLLTARHIESRKEPKMDDLEGAVLLGKYVYVITSYAKKGNARRLVRFRMCVDGFSSEPESASGEENLKKKIRKALRGEFPKLKKSDFSGKKFNIEGLAAAKTGKELMIGLRGPTCGGAALIVRTKGLESAFGPNQSPIGISKKKKHTHKLKLKGGGIRSMTCMPDGRSYLIISGKSVDGKKKFKCSGADEKVKFILWHWGGKKDDKPKNIHCFTPTEENRIKVQPEGITPMTLYGNKRTLLIVSDDGEKAQGLSNYMRPGRYWIVSPERYQHIFADLKD
ncbi:MAG: DUF3616 domain-containing protein, partial [Gammaproteobacteria bacterium]|nr:DUF3616 domain-containing protein [Gammaproteobacteria bacterium]